MEKEKWIEAVFESTKGLQRQQPSPFLFEKILSKIGAERIIPNTGPDFKWALGLCMALIITINIVSLTRAKHISSEEEQQSSAFNNATVYNY